MTAEMRSIFHTICPTGPHTVDDDTLDRAYRAMHAAAPVEFCPEARIVGLEMRLRDAQIAYDQLAMLLRNCARDRDAAFSCERDADEWSDALLQERAELRLELSRLHAILATSEPGAHDYHGPVADGRAVPDPVHERFHGSIGDVLAGKVLPKAREQMREALDRAPKEKAPFPAVVALGDRRRIGG